MHDTDDLLTAFRDYIAKSPHVLGGGDILTLRRGDDVARAVILTRVLSGISIKDEGPAIKRFVFIIPPDENAGATIDRIREEFIVQYERQSGHSHDERAGKWVRHRLLAEQAGSGRFDDALAIIKAQPNHSAVIVLGAERYRDDAVASFVPEGASGPLVSEDVWVPQVAALAMQAAQAVAGRKVYFALLVDELSPVRPQLIELLQSVERCGVMGESSETIGEAVIGKQADQWDRWLAEGKVGQVLQAIGALPSPMDKQKPYLRTQILAKAGLRNEALADLRQELERGHEFDPPSSVRLARIASEAGANLLATTLLEPVTEELINREDLESALKTAEQVGNVELAKYHLRLGKGDYVAHKPRARVRRLPF